MKKTILKLAFVGVCIAAIVFLLLPFLETTPPATTDLKSAQPQIDTSTNPLATIAQRLAGLFGRRTYREGQRLAAAPVATPATEAALSPTAYAYQNAPLAEQPINAGPQADTPQDSTYQTISVSPKASYDEYGNASVQTDSGEWVLIRQTAPQSSTPGMHEVNVHDNPYDRYLRKERAMRVGQPARKMQAEIPDSKWARLVQPFKQWFSGKPESNTVRPAAPNNARATRLASASNRMPSTDTTSTAGPMRLALPNITLQQWKNMTDEEREHFKERHAVDQFMQMISGERSAREAAEIMADAKFPNPQTKEEKQQKEQYTNQMHQEYLQGIKNGLLANIEADSIGKQPVDEMVYILGCGDKSLPSASEPCTASGSVAGQPANVPTPADVIAQQQAKNEESFFAQTKFHFPKDLPVTPVFAPTTRQTIEDAAQNPDPNVQKAVKIFDLAFKTQNCEEKPCYLVPAATQRNPKLADTFSMSNATVKWDPAHVEEKLLPLYVQNEVDALGPQATPEEQAQKRKEAEEEFKKHVPALLPNTEQDLRQVQGNNLQQADPNNPQRDPQNITVFNVMDASTALQVAQALGNPFILRGQEPISNSRSPEEASEQITNSNAHVVNEAKEVARSILTPKYQEALATKVKEIATIFKKGKTNTPAGAKLGEISIKQ